VTRTPAGDRRQARCPCWDCSSTAPCGNAGGFRISWRGVASRVSFPSSRCPKTRWMTRTSASVSGTPSSTGSPALTSKPPFVHRAALVGLGERTLSNAAATAASPSRPPRGRRGTRARIPVWYSSGSSESTRNWLTVNPPGTASGRRWRAGSAVTCSGMPLTAKRSCDSACASACVPSTRRRAAHVCQAPLPVSPSRTTRISPRPLTLVRHSPHSNRDRVTTCRP
jgi:hypothetical protein